MSREKQIEEMTRDIPQRIVAYDRDPDGQYLYTEQRLEIAQTLYNAGYRKQKEGNWKFVTKMSEPIYWECSACGYKTFDIKGDTNFCPNCGAKMKGGAE